jgi:hypothetical protein
MWFICPRINRNAFKIFVGKQSLRERAENEQLYKADFPEADIPPEVLIALLGIKEIQSPYAAQERNHADLEKGRRSRN